MTAVTLMAKLMEIRAAARNEDHPRVCSLVTEAQDYALEIQREMVSLLRENEELHATFRAS